MVFTALFLLLLKGALAQQIIDLSTAPWVLSNPQYNISVPGNVPSQAHLDLFKANIIPDPYYGLGETQLRWVTQTNWTYTAPLDGL